MPSMHAVIVEADADAAASIESVLVKSGFEVSVVNEGRAGVALVRQFAPVLVTVDLGLPGMDGVAVVRELRGFSDAYLIMITESTDEIDVIRAFEAGADDFVVKPFRSAELRARADAMLRRPRARSSAAQAVAVGTAVASPSPASTALLGAPSTPPPAVLPPPEESVAGARVMLTGISETDPVHPAPTPVDLDGFMVWGDLRIHVPTHAVTHGGRTINLDEPEHVLLSSLVHSGRRVRSRSDLVLVLRGDDPGARKFVNEADKRGVDERVAAVRAKLGDDPVAPRVIEGVKGVGYRMVDPA